jgi:protease secretion system membrane fusion protein
VPRNHQLELERQASEVSRNINHAKQAAEESRLRYKQVQDSYHQEVETNLAEIKRDISNAYEKMQVLHEDLNHTIIKSPVKGYVTGLAVHTVGGVITPGMKLMEIVPTSDKLIFEAHIPSHLIERVKPGLIVDINLHNFPSETRLVIEGKVISVSADLLTDQNPNAPPYFLGLVEVTDSGIKKLGKNQLQAGMEADVVIKTGERSLLSYIIKPLFRRLNSSLKEI